MSTDTLSELNYKPSKGKLFRKEWKKQIFLLVVSAILLIYGIIFYYIPLFGWITAFQDYKPGKGFLGSEWVGFKKFADLFKNPNFKFTFRNTLVMGVLNLASGFIMNILFALLLNEIRISAVKRVIQTISYLPHFLSWVIVSAIVRDVLSADNGIVNELLGTHINFFSETKYFWPIVMIANVWKETGWGAIIYLAAITSIDPSLYEAADMDGASRLQKMWYITLPSLKPTIIVLLLINVGNVLNAGFELQYILGNDVIYKVSKTIDIFVLEWGLEKFDYSLGTAAGIFKSVISIILVLFANWLSKKTTDEGLF